MNYDFKMKNLLTLFGNNPEALANEFTKQLNAELEKENALSEATTQFIKAWNNFCDKYFLKIKAWNNFCDKYFLKNEIPKDYKVEDFYLKDTDPNRILNKIIERLPILEQTEKAINDFTKVFPNFVDKYLK